MRDELGSCAPGSFTAVVLFYIYGAAAGPAVARCESHDSSAGNRDGPVIQAPHRLHVTPPALPNPLLDARHSQQRQAACPQTHTRLRARAHTHAQWFCSFYGHIRPSVFQDPLCALVSISNFINPSTSFLPKFLLSDLNCLASRCLKFMRTDCSHCLDFTFNIRLAR